MMKNKEKMGVQLSIILVLILNILSFIMATAIQFMPDFLNNIFGRYMIGYIFPLILLPLTICFCKKLEMNLENIGISKKNFLKSFFMGLVFSIILIIVFGINRRYNNFETMTLSFFYYLFCVSCVEEIVFRGFVRTNISKNKKRAYIYTGILFSISHIPFHWIISNADIMLFVFNKIIALTSYVIIHYFLQVVYDKYENCIGPIVIHFTIDFFGIFIK